MAKTPEDLANDWYMEGNRGVHLRLQFWLVIEGLLLTAFSLASEDSVGNDNWRIRFGIALAGLTISWLWHSYYIRMWEWTSWYFLKARKLFESLGDEYKGIFPPDDAFSLMKARGMGSKWVGHAVLAVFFVLWGILATASWDEIRHDFESLENVEVMKLITLVGIAIALVTSVREILDWQEED